MKTIETWHTDLTELYKKDVNEFLKVIAQCNDEIVLAFIAKYKISPNEAVGCYQGNKFWVERKDRTKDTDYWEGFDAAIKVVDNVLHGLNFTCRYEADQIIDLVEREVAEYKKDG